MADLFPSILAWLALTMPTAPPDEWSQDPLFRLQVIQMAVAEEIIDPLWAKNWFNYPSAYSSDLLLLRTRWRESRDWPRLHEVKRYPPHLICQDQERFASQLKGWMIQRSLLEAQHESPQVLAFLEEMRIYQMVWDQAEQATNPSRGILERRRALGRLREMLGEELYWAGYLPPPVPIHYLPRY